MTFAAPLFLVLGAGAALAAAALHLIARAEPPERDLPTARFVPASALRAPAVQRRPTDLLLLLVRALALLLLGVALAGPSVAGAKRALAHVVLLDRSRAVGDPADALARARATFRDGDVFVVFDSTARRAVPDSVAAAPSRERGALSAALVVAAREGRRLAARADSLELVLISPLVDEEWDAAAPRLRALWPGGVRVERVAAAAPAPRPAIIVAGAPDDPLRASAALLGAGSGPLSVRLVRGIPTADDSAVARLGGVLVTWPADPAARYGRRPRADTVGAVAADGAVVVASFVRVAAPEGGRPIAWWVDGEAAAVERPLGAGCTREVAVPVTPAGDLVLRPGMLRFVAAMTAPCGGMPRLTPVPDSLVTALVSARSTQPLRVTAGGSRPLMAALFALALATLVAEQVLRRRAAR